MKRKKEWKKTSKRYGVTERKNTIKGLTLNGNLQWDMIYMTEYRRLPATRADFEVANSFCEMFNARKLFHGLEYVLLRKSGSKYTTPANNLREFVETSATSFSQYKTRRKNCEIDEINWQNVTS